MACYGCIHQDQEYNCKLTRCIYPPYKPTKKGIDMNNNCTYHKENNMNSLFTNPLSIVAIQTEYHLFKFIMEFIDSIQHDDEHNDEFLSALLDAKKSLKNLMKFF